MRQLLAARRAPFVSSILLSLCLIDVGCKGDEPQGPNTGVTGRFDGVLTGPEGQPGVLRLDFTRRQALRQLQSTGGLIELSGTITLDITNDGTWETVVFAAGSTYDPATGAVHLSASTEVGGVTWTVVLDGVVTGTDFRGTIRFNGGPPLPVFAAAGYSVHLLCGTISGAASGWINLALAGNAGGAVVRLANGTTSLLVGTVMSNAVSFNATSGAGVVSGTIGTPATGDYSDGAGTTSSWSAIGSLCPTLGASAPDAGTTITDSGVAPDSGAMIADSGTTPDSGSTTPDSGGTTPDSGATPDSGVPSGPGETCASATTLAIGIDQTGQSLAGFSNDYASASTSCPQGGADRVYTVMVPAGQRVTFTVTAAPGSSVLGNLVAGTAACNAPLTTCERSFLATNNQLVRPVRWFNDTGSTAPAFLIVEAQGQQPSSFTIRADIDTPAAGDVCELPGAPITGSISLGGQSTASFVGDMTTAVSFTQDRVYAIDLAPNQRVDITPTITGGGASFFLLGDVADCYAPDLSRVDVGTRLPPIGISYINGGASTAHLYYVVANSARDVPPTPTTFSLEIAFTTLLAGETCFNASVPPISASTTLSGQTIDAYTDDCNILGFDRFYEVELAPEQRLFAAVSESIQNFDPGLLVLQCGDQMLSGCPQGPPNVDTIVANRTSGPQRYQLFVGSGFGIGRQGATYSLELDIASPPGDSCGLAEPPITATTLGIAGTTARYAGDFVITPSIPSCNIPSQLSPDRLHWIQLPAGMELTTTANMGGDFRAYLALTRSTPAACNMTCVLGANQGPSSPAQIVYRNTSAATEDLLLIVGTTRLNGARGGSAYTLDVTIAP